MKIFTFAFIALSSLTISATTFAATATGRVTVTLGSDHSNEVVISGAPAALIADKILNQSLWSNDGDGLRSISGADVSCNETSVHNPKSSKADKDGYVRTGISCSYSVKP